MITKDHDFGYLVDCERCSAGEDLEVVDFQDAVDLIKEMGWQIQKDENGWLHICPSCQEGGR